MAWTDERMDDFAAHAYRRFDAVDKRFDAVDRRFDSIERRMGSIERRMEDGFTRVDEEFRGLRAEMNQRFDGLQRSLLQLGGGVIAALIAGFMGLIATQL